jgi:lysine biosynthesis protein LysW
MKFKCPECLNAFEIDLPEQHELVSCPCCSCDFEAGTVNGKTDLLPIELTEKETGGRIVKDF